MLPKNKKLKSKHLLKQSNLNKIADRCLSNQEKFTWVISCLDLKFSMEAKVELEMQVEWEVFNRMILNWLKLLDKVYLKVNNKLANNQLPLYLNYNQLLKRNNNMFQWHRNMMKSNLKDWLFKWVFKKWKRKKRKKNKKKMIKNNDL